MAPAPPIPRCWRGPNWGRNSAARPRTANPLAASATTTLANSGPRPAMRTTASTRVRLGKAPAAPATDRRRFLPLPIAKRGGGSRRGVAEILNPNTAGHSSRSRRFPAAYRQALDLRRHVSSLTPVAPASVPAAPRSISDLLSLRNHSPNLRRQSLSLRNQVPHPRRQSLSLRNQVPHPRRQSLSLRNHVPPPRRQSLSLRNHVPPPRRQSPSLRAHIPSLGRRMLSFRTHLLSLGEHSPSLRNYFPSLGRHFPSLRDHLASLGRDLLRLGRDLLSLGNHPPSLRDHFPSRGEQLSTLTLVAPASVPASLRLRAHLPSFRT